MNSRFTPAVLLILLFAGCSSPDEPTIGFYLAIHRGDLNQIERHIHWGTNINQADANGDPPLHVAARQGRYVIAKLLIGKGAEIDALDPTEHSALHAALMTGRTQIADLLIESGAAIDADRLLDETVTNRVNDRDVLNFLIRQGANPNHIDTAGKTPLINAILDDNRVLSRMLISHGADVNQQDAGGKRPLQHAEASRNPEIIQLLGRNGAF